MVPSRSVAITHAEEWSRSDFPPHKVCILVLLLHVVRLIPCLRQRREPERSKVPVNPILSIKGSAVVATVRRRSFLSIDNREPSVAACLSTRHRLLLVLALAGTGSHWVCIASRGN